MNAGKSAGEQARSAEKASEVLRRKAANADRAAANWSKGEAGERMVGEVLRRLASEGWLILDDRKHPGGGNIDHIAIGPPGIAVIDAKNWSYPVTLAGQKLRTGRYDQSAALRHLEEMVDAVGKVVSATTPVPIRGYLVLTGDADRDRPSDDLGQLRVLGVDGLAKRLRGAPPALSRPAMEAAYRDVSLAMPDMSDAATPPSAASATREAERLHPIFEKTHRFYYLHKWSKGGHSRLYLADDQDESLGWVDVKTGRVETECTDKDDAKLAGAILSAAELDGVKLSSDDLPKVGPRLKIPRVVSRAMGIHMSVLIGQEWRARGNHRLYGTLIDPGEAKVDLGWVDARTGECHPKTIGRVSKDRPRTHEEYLRRIWERWPRRPTSGG